MSRPLAATQAQLDKVMVGQQKAARCLATSIAVVERQAAERQEQEKREMATETELSLLVHNTNVALSEAAATSQKSAQQAAMQQAAASAAAATRRAETQANINALRLQSDAAKAATLQSEEQTALELAVLQAQTEAAKEKRAAATALEEAELEAKNAEKAAMLKHQATMQRAQQVKLELEVEERNQKRGKSLMSRAPPARPPALLGSRGPASCPPLSPYVASETRPTATWLAYMTIMCPHARRAQAGDQGAQGKAGGGDIVVGGGGEC
jgi:hypothetical protein